MLSEIQISRTLLHPFHNIFATWNISKSSLELSRKRAGRGNVERDPAKRKNTREGERSEIQCFHPFFFEFSNKIVVLGD